MTRIDQSELDRLVDGQLTDPQRRDVLTRLEEEPDGWRRCALAFLEAQSWKEALGVLAGRSSEPVAPASPAPPRSARRSTAWGTLLAMAASFLLALGLGLVIRGGWPAGGGQAPSGDVAESQPPAAGLPAPVAPDEPVRLAADAAPVAVSRAPAQRPWQMVRIPVRQQEGNVQWIEVPAVASDRVDDGWLSGTPAPLTPEVLRDLRAAGLDVRQSRQLVPMPMEGGGRVVVPVDDVDVQYVGGPAYQ